MPKKQIRLITKLKNMSHFKNNMHVYDDSDEMVSFLLRTDKSEREKF